MYGFLCVPWSYLLLLWPPVILVQSLGVGERPHAEDTCGRQSTPWIAGTFLPGPPSMGIYPKPATKNTVACCGTRPPQPVAQVAHAKTWSNSIGIVSYFRHIPLSDRRDTAAGVYLVEGYIYIHVYSL